MRKEMGEMKKIMVAGVASLVSACSIAMAADVLVKVEENSAYVWRGKTINDGMVIQPSLELDKGSFGLTVWGNANSSDYDGRFDKNKFSEVDVKPTYTVSESNVTFTAGLRKYIYLNQSESKTGADNATGTNAIPKAGSAEVYGNIRYKANSGFYGGLLVAYDFDDYKDYYLRLSTGYEGSIGTDFSYILDASAGAVGRGLADNRHDGLHEYELSAGMAYSLSGDLVVGARIAYTDTLNKDTLAKQDVNFYGGASIGYRF
jgi:opacity protein-like surface antigen